MNVGVAVDRRRRPARSIDPWFLGSADENDVQGYAGMPVNVNNLTVDFPLDIGAAGTVFPRTKAYFVAVDRAVISYRPVARRRLRPAPGSTTSTPPLLGLLTTPRRRRAGRRSPCV